MGSLNWMGVVLFTGLYAATFVFTENPGLLLNGIGITVVVSGTLGAMCLSYPFADIHAATLVALNTYSRKMLTPERVIAVLRDLAVRTHSDGLLALENYSEQTTIGFLRRALNLLVDGFKDDDLYEILHTEMFYFKQRRSQHERVFRHAAKLAPAFGVAGSVIGLIAMLAGIGDPEVVLKSIPIALTSTLYGIVISNFLLTPIAGSIHARTERELLLQQLVTDGVITIRREPNPTRLESFLTPASRHHENRSIDEIRNGIRDLHLEQP
ncbi:MAG: MotA/TolQ/ExbB proton channel family protein [Proteobacteria bacterium]|nr:MotA/TolQ/ExbB proton channel family protein [Pseudomonadota bacterium]